MTSLYLTPSAPRSLARLTFGDPVEGMPDVAPPYTPVRPRPSYQDALAHLERYRQGRMASAASREDWETHDRWAEARILPALRFHEHRTHPETVPALLTEVFWDDESVTGRLFTVTGGGDPCVEDAVLLRFTGAEAVAFTPVVLAR